MLRRLALEEFVIVEACALEFGAGLNVLTGETGAGKSILVDALGLLCGDRGGAEWIRQGAARLAIEGELDLPREGPLRRNLEAAGIPAGEDVLLLRREIGADGRSRTFINGRQVLVSQLREWTAGLLRIVGQGDQRALLESGEAELLLDRYGGLEPEADRYRAIRDRYLERRREAAELREQADRFRGEADWLRYQTAEIRELDPSPGERDELVERRKRIEERRRGAGWIEEIRTRLVEEEGSVVDHVESLLHRLRGASGEPWEPIREALLSLRESIREIDRLLPALEEEGSGEIEEIEERIRSLGELMRKHGRSEEELLAHRVELERRIEVGEALEERIALSIEEGEAIREALGAQAERLSVHRRESAARLEEQVRPELAALGLPDAALAFAFRRTEDARGAGSGDPSWAPHAGGFDQISLRFRSHGAIGWGELGKAASGGELSRVLLAIQAALGETAPPGTWVFDEIDQGIGGETANRLAGRLSRLATRSQALLVTHLPAVAAAADRHFRVSKEDRKGRPWVRVDAVQGDARLAELARMLSGDESSAIARRHARELLSR
jgi:DNA repair protein RecN (Recombination protein N)